MSECKLLLLNVGKLGQFVLIRQAQLAAPYRSAILKQNFWPLKGHIMKKIIFAALLTGAASTATAAPLIDLYGGVYTWNAKPSGSIASHGEGKVDFKDDLNFGSDNTMVMYLGLEHFVPLVPNVRLRHMGMKDSANGTLSHEVTIDDKQFTGSTSVHSKYDIDMTDLTLYYTPWKTLVKIDAGLTVRQLDAKFSVSGKIDDKHETADLSAKETIPLLHLGVSGKLPFTGFYAGAEVNRISYSSNRFGDYHAKIGWRSKYLLGVEAGYSQVSLKLDDVSDIDSSLDWKGPYVTLSLSF